MRAVFLPLLLPSALLLAACGDKDNSDGDSGDTTDGGGDDGGSDDGGSDDGGDDSGTAPVDADDDGYDETEDCDDTDAAVNPGADEVCDGIDNDCDEEIDEEVTTTFYTDADEDGYGDAGAPVEACELSEGLVEDATDCDDGDAEVSPGAEEITCDAVDNDCDGTTDANTVPTTWSTLGEAVAAVEDGAEICLEPGTYTEQLDLSGRTLIITGQLGPASTVFDVGTSTPMISIAGESETFAAGNLTLSGLTITGGEVSAHGTDVSGGFAYVEGGTLRMEDIEVAALSSSMADGGSLEGLLVYAVDSSLGIEELTVDGVAFALTGESDNYDLLAGGLIRTVRGELDIHTMTVTDLTVTGDEDRHTCNVGSLVLAADDDGDLSRDVDELKGTALSIADVEILDSTISLHCAEHAIGAGLMYFQDTDGELTGLRVTGLAADTSAATSASTSTLVRSWAGYTMDLQISGLDLSDNTFRSEAYYAGVVALVDTSLADLSDVVIWNNTMDASASSSGYLSGLVNADDGHLSFVDLRGNTLETSGYASALLENVADKGEASLRQFIIAGNRVEAADLYAGALEVIGDGSTVTARNGDVVGNTFAGAVRYSGTGIVRGGGERDGDLATVSGVQVVDNVYVGDDDLPAVATWWEESFALEHSNLFGNTSDEAEWGDVVGSDGNISADPLYTDVSGDDATTWDLTLGEGSPAIDAGDPSITDDDDSTSDMGAYGGPGGTDW